MTTFLVREPGIVRDGLSTFQPPDDPAAWPAWRESLRAWRDTTRARYDWWRYRGLSGTAPVSALVQLNDQRLAPRSGQLDLLGFVDAFRRRFGHLDEVLLWAGYPQLGLDGRDQFDHLNDQPGARPGLRQAVEALRDRGVRVLIPWCPWDDRAHPRDHGEALLHAVADLGVDGVFLDTLTEGGAMSERLLTRFPHLLLPSELGLPLEHLPTHRSSWSQCQAESSAPAVLRHRWCEPRHSTHVIDRWAADRSGDLHRAWLNGAGCVVWDNVYGTWNGWSDADARRLRLIADVQHAWPWLFGSLTALDGWTPLSERPRPWVYASRWCGRGIEVITACSRAGHDESAVPFAVSGSAAFDLDRGVELPIRHGHVAIDLAAGDVGGVLVLHGALPATARRLLARRRADAQGDHGATAPMPCENTRERVVGDGAGRAVVPAGSHAITRRSRWRECGIDGRHDAAAFRLPTPLGAELSVPMTVLSDGFAIDPQPVTCAAFREFLRVSGWRPTHAHRFLGSGADDAPAVQVDPDDARAFARWRGARLPTAEEWLLAAQRGAIDPRAGGVWEWTATGGDDGVVRWALLVGGADLDATRDGGSAWYVAGGRDDGTRTVKTLLGWSGTDRYATVGFRCCVDLGDA